MRPLEGLRVLDLSRMVAGGLAGMLLADFGADVIKVEQPDVGDPLRKWTTGGAALWWQVYARNKRHITLNVQSAEGRALLLELLPRFDIMLESFVPGTLDRYGLDWETLRAAHPNLVIVRISGWGQSGPASGRPGLGTLVEAASGLAAMTGDSGSPPLLPSFPVADMFSGLYAAYAAMIAIHHREAQGGRGQEIDVSLFESLFSVLGPLAAEYAIAGKVRSRTGNRSTNSAPRGCYVTRDGRWIAVSGSTPKMAERFLEAYGLSALLKDPRFATNETRVRHVEELNEVVSRAIGERTLEENLSIIETHQLTAHVVQTIHEIALDPHWLARQLLIDVRTRDGSVCMHNITPRFSMTQGEIRSAGGDLGADNASVYGAELGLNRDELARLRASGVI